MKKFHYIASQQDGKIVERDMEAKEVSEVLAFLSKNNLKPVSVKPVSESGKKELHIFGGKVNLVDQIFISKYLALMLRIGTGLLEAINILINDFKKPAVRSMLIEIRSSLEQGNPFYTTFAKYPKIFGDVYVNLVRAGEESGNLEKTFADLTVMLTKQKELKEQIRGALIYPIILLIGAIAILIFMVMFALPRIAKVFLEGGFEPPAFSRVVFSVGLFLGEYAVASLSALGIAIVIFIILNKYSLVFKKFVFSILSEIPVVHDIVKKIALQRFASTLASLVRSGMPLTRGLEITSRAVGNVQLEASLRRVSEEGLAKGLTVGEAFRREPYFPQTVSNLVGISEQAGHIEEVLETLSDFYTKEIDGSIKTLVSFLEPVMLLVIGAVIGLIALAIIVPIYQLTTQF